MYDTVRWLIEKERGNCQKCFPFCNCCSSDTQCATCTKTLAKNHRRLRCNYCSILHHNKCGQFKPTTFQRQFQSVIKTWICPRCVTKSLLAELPMAGIGNTSCQPLFLDEGEECMVRMYGEDFDSTETRAVPQIDNLESSLLSRMSWSISP